MRYCIQSADSGDSVTPLLTVPEFQQRLLRFDGGAEERGDADRDEVLYVLEGAATAHVAGESHELTPGTGLFVARGTPWHVESADELLLLSVLIEEPLPATASHAVIDSRERGTATAGREFTLLSHPENGCESVTQFVGYIPVGRAPDHYHRYDEVVYVLAGNGAFHTDGETEILSPGSCVHLPARLIHCLENRGPGEMRVLGVFRPAGSPAEAYYPDDSPAAVPIAC
jgi:quercetin dioxygenase-like cupin family protein